MKKFNLSSFLLVFGAILFLSVLSTSCSKEKEEPENTGDKEIISTPDEGSKAIYFLPPKGFENKTDKEKQAFFENLTQDQSEKLEENYRVSDYLESIGLLEKMENLIT